MFEKAFLCTLDGFIDGEKAFGTFKNLSKRQSVINENYVRTMSESGEDILHERLSTLALKRDEILLEDEDDETVLFGVSNKNIDEENFDASKLSEIEDNKPRKQYKESSGNKLHATTQKVNDSSVSNSESSNRTDSNRRLSANFYLGIPLKEQPQRQSISSITSRQSFKDIENEIFLTGSWTASGDLKNIEIRDVRQYRLGSQQINAKIIDFVSDITIIEKDTAKGSITIRINDDDSEKLSVIVIKCQANGVRDNTDVFIGNFSNEEKDLRINVEANFVSTLTETKQRPQKVSSNSIRFNPIEEDVRKNRQ